MKKLLIMRGLPGSGKSYTARQLAGDKGVVYSTDEYFITQIGDDRTKYTFKPTFLADAHKWNLLRAQRAIDKMFNEESLGPVVIDNTNTQAWESHKYVLFASSYGIEVDIVEPTSDWWKEIRPLLGDKKSNRDKLKKWAVFLSEKNTHEVPAFSIEKMMWRWEEFDVNKILETPPPNR